MFLSTGAYSTPSWTRCWFSRDAQAPVEHTIESGRGEPLALLPRTLGSTGIPHYSSAILSHHGPPEPLLHEGQGPLLALVASVPMYPIKHHVALSHGDDEG